MKHIFLTLVVGAVTSLSGCTNMDAAVGLTNTLGITDIKRPNNEVQDWLHKENCKDTVLGCSVRVKE